MASGSLFNTKRLLTHLYNDYKDEVIDILNINGFEIARVPDSYKNKEDWGDLDVILPLPKISKDKLKEIFNITDEDINVNSNVMSFKYKDFQTDLIFVAPEDVNSTLEYMRQSSTSNMVGRIIHKLGYSLTNRGLEYHVKLKDSDDLGQFVITKDRKRIHEFMGLNHEEWLDGFNSAEQMYEWLIKSPYFNKEYYKYENLNNINKKRDRKRQDYHNFVLYCENKDFENNYECRNKVEHLFRGLLFFEEQGWWIDKSKNMILERRDTINANAKWNGHIISELTGLEGERLGKCIAKYKKYWADGVEKDYRAYILITNKNQLVADFKFWYKFDYKL